MGFSPSIQTRRKRHAEAVLIFGAGEPLEKHLSRKLKGEWRDEVREQRGEESKRLWASALGLTPVACGLSGWVPHHWDEDRWVEAEREADKILAEQRAKNVDARRWLWSQIKAAKSFSTQELAERLGATCEREARDLLDAFVFDLFHLHRNLWRAFKHQKALEAGLTEVEAYAQTKREESKLKRIWAHPAPLTQLNRVKRPRPIQHRPQVQPTAPTN